MRVHSKDLKEGMVLARDLRNKTFIILRKGATLSPAMIQTIKHRGIRSVDVEEGGDLLRKDQFQQMFQFDDEREKYQERHQQIDNMFQGCDEGNSQMQMLRYCVIGWLEQEYARDKG